MERGGLVSGFHSGRIDCGGFVKFVIPVARLPRGGTLPSDLLMMPFCVPMSDELELTAAVVSLFQPGLLLLDVLIERNAR